MSIPIHYDKNMSAILTDPEPYLHLLSEHISSGGTLQEFAKSWGVPYRTLSAWINDDDNRRELYLTAITLRDEYLSDIVIRQLRSMCDANISGAFDEDNNMLPVKEMPVDVQRSILAVQVDESYTSVVTGITTTTKKIRLVDPAKAVELLGKYRKMFVDRVEHTGKIDFNAIKFFDDSTG